MPKWVVRLLIALGVLILAGFVAHLLGVGGERTGQVLGASTLIAIAIATFLVGAFVGEFHVGEYGAAGPLSRWVGASICIIVSIVFLFAGVLLLVRA
jgi:hypothetical protein